MKLNNILIPLIKKEFNLLLHWINNCPTLCEDKNSERNLNLHLSIDKFWNEFEKKIILEHVKKSNLKNLNIYFHSCKMKDIESIYLNDLKKYNKDNENYEKLSTLEFGLKNGPNKQFFNSIEKIIMDFKPSLNDCVILLEVDTLIIKNNWIDLINKKLSEYNSFWIAGSRPINHIYLDPWLKRHLNGNAIYGIGDKDFNKFLIMWQSIVRYIAKKFKLIAYDCAMEYFFEFEEDKIKENYKFIGESYSDKLLEVDFIQNILEPINDLAYTQKIDAISNQTIIIHSKNISKFAGAMNIARENEFEKYLKIKHPINKRFNLINTHPISYFFEDKENTFNTEVAEKIIDDEKLFSHPYTKKLLDLCIWKHA